MKRIKTRNFELGELLFFLLVLLTVIVETTGKMMCKSNSMCVLNDRDSCCKAVNSKDGICSPKIQLGGKCQKRVKIKFLSNEGIAFSSCGCAKGLTCTRVVKKRKNKKKGKKAYRIKYLCRPIPKGPREISELRRWS